MSSMVRKSLAGAFLVFLATEGPASSQSVVSVPVVQPVPQSSPTPVWQGQTFVPTSGEGSEWDRARAQLRLSAATPMAQEVERWKLLASTDNLAFADYSGFLVAYPCFPE